MHGLFADADGAQAAFLRIANVGHAVTAVASLSGAELLVGCSGGRIIAVETMTGLWREQTQDASVPDMGGVLRFEVLSRELAYGLKHGHLLRFNGQHWTALAALQNWLIFTLSGRTKEFLPFLEPI